MILMSARSKKDLAGLIISITICKTVLIKLRLICVFLTKFRSVIMNIYNYKVLVFKRSIAIPVTILQ
jgi:hypothetical protein